MVMTAIANAAAAIFAAFVFFMRCSFGSDGGGSPHGSSVASPQCKVVTADTKERLPAIRNGSRVRPSLRA
jgi:hypothetical protein